jgi:hypothetical protein
MDSVGRSEFQRMITLHDWIAEQKNLLTEFEQWWKESHRCSSVQFPASLDEGDWTNSLRSSVSSEEAPLEGARWETRGLPGRM